jgi:hypothetical protein
MDGKPKPRWIRFRLSSFLWAVLIVALVAGWLADRGRLGRELRHTTKLLKIYQRELTNMSVLSESQQRELDGLQGLAASAQP